MSQSIVFDSQTQSIKNLAWWLYIFHALSLVFSLGALSWSTKALATSDIA